MPFYRRKFIKKTLIVSALVFLGSNGSLKAEDNEISKDVYRDKLTGNYMHICSEENDTLFVAETCGKFWDKYPRKREQLIKEVPEYKELKKGSEVMIPVRKEGVMTWALGRVSFLYEDGSISVMEYYTNPGITGGTTSWMIPYDYIAKKNSIAPLSSEKQVCAKEAFDIFYGPSNSRKYSFEKGEPLTPHEFFNNGMMAVSYQGFFKNIFSYGKDSKLPVPQEKIEPCSAQNDKLVDDGKRSNKPAAKEIVIPATHSQNIEK